MWTLSYIERPQSSGSTSEEILTSLFNLKDHSLEVNFEKLTNSIKHEIKKLLCERFCLYHFMAHLSNYIIAQQSKRNGTRSGIHKPALLVSYRNESL